MWRKWREFSLAWYMSDETNVSSVTYRVRQDLTGNGVNHYLSMVPHLPLVSENHSKDKRRHHRLITIKRKVRVFNEFVVNHHSPTQWVSPLGESLVSSSWPHFSKFLVFVISHVLVTKIFNFLQNYRTS